MDVRGVPVPRLFYGTAWKEHQTRRLVEEAVISGFRGIDTANQRKHYDEEGVGLGVRDAYARRRIPPNELFLQTKFTFRAGQDHRLPYDPKASIGDQVHQSFAKSLQHLRSERIDSLILHGPSRRDRLDAPDFEAWAAMEAIHETGRVSLLGVSNVGPKHLVMLLERATVRPAFVQNRCYAVRGWDRDIRKICSEAGMVYQGFSLLTANRQFLGSVPITSLAKRYRKTPAQVIFRFALDLGMIALTGTTDPAHMRDDLDIFDFQLTPPEIQSLEQLDKGI